MNTEGDTIRDAVLVTDGDTEMGQVCFLHCFTVLFYIEIVTSTIIFPPSSIGMQMKT